MVDKAHGMGMRVVLDAVFNHTAPEFFAFRDLEKNWENSPYRDWYYCQGKPKRPMLPFVKPIHVKRFYPDAGIETYTDACRVAVDAMGIDPLARNVLVTHQFVTGALPSESE